MKNKKKIGFTLVELLAVIVILSIIMTITVPIILVQVKKAEKRSFEISVELVKKNTEDYLLKQGLKRLPDCEEKFVNLEDLSLKNKENAFSLENSYVCYDSEQQCNYIYAISKKKNYKKYGCYDDDKITEIDKSADYSIPQFTNFVYQYEDDGSSLVVDIDWYDEGSDIKEELYRIKEAGSNNWSKWQISKKFTGINFEKKYTIQSKATNEAGRFKIAKTTTEPILEDTPTISAKNYGRSIDFKYSSSDSGSGVNHYVLNYINSTVMGQSSTKYESVILSSSSNTYSINTQTSSTYKYYICAVDKAGNEKCSNKISTTTYIGIRAANRTKGSKIKYGTKDWYVINDSGSSKGSYLTLIAANVAGYTSGGNDYNYANTYLNDQSLPYGYMASNSLIKKDCNNGGIFKQNGNCITSDSGNNGYNYYSDLSSPYWIGSGTVVVPTGYTEYEQDDNNFMLTGAAGTTYKTSHPDTTEMISKYSKTYVSKSYISGQTIYPNNSETNFSYNGTTTKTDWYGSAYYKRLTVNPHIDHKNRLSFFGQSYSYDFTYNTDTLVSGSDTGNNILDTGHLIVIPCGGNYSSIEFVAGSNNFTYKLNHKFGGTSNSVTRTYTEVHAAGKSSSTKVANSTYGYVRTYNNSSDSNCRNVGYSTVSSTTKYFYYRPYIYVNESYDKDGN